MCRKNKAIQISILTLFYSPMMFSDYILAEASHDTITPNDSDNRKNSLSPTFQQEQVKQKQTAGATNLIIPEQENRLSTLQDALDYQPGIIIQNFFGGTDQPRLNIRGSGVQSAPLSRGVLLLQDGLPITDADGDFHISTLDMREARLISVYRGANNTHPQANSLGGELNFISYTGKDELGSARYEYGAFGREATQIALGYRDDDMDSRISLSYHHFDGYRDHSTSQRKSKSDLKSIFKIVIMRDPHRNVQQGRIANRANWSLDNQSVELGLWYQRTHDNFVTLTDYVLSNTIKTFRKNKKHLNYIAVCSVKPK